MLETEVDVDVVGNFPKAFRARPLTNTARTLATARGRFSAARIKHPQAAD